MAYYERTGSTGKPMDVKKADVRNTKGGITPNKAIRRPANQPVKKMTGYRKQGR